MLDPMLCVAHAEHLNHGVRNPCCMPQRTLQFGTIVKTAPETSWFS